MKNKIILSTITIITIIQIIIWGIFMLVNESISSDLALNYGLVILSVNIIVYFIIEKKVITFYNITKLNFTTISLITWNIINIIIAVLVNKLLEIGILSYCIDDGWACFLNGIEYLIFPFIVAVSSIAILIIKLLHWISKYIIIK